MIAPDRCGEAARRLAAKMVADQAVDIMLSVVGVRLNAAEDVKRLDAGEAALVVVATRGAAHRVLAWLRAQCRVASAEVERPESGR